MFEATDFQIIPPFTNEPYINPDDPDVRSLMNQIGRASCRERV